MNLEANCTRDDTLPSSVPVPDGSLAMSLIGMGYAPPWLTEQGSEDFTYYDQIVRQPMPILLAVREGNTTAAQVVCVTPDKIAQGSREPEGPWPPSVAGRLRGINSCLIVLVSALVSFLVM